MYAHVNIGKEVLKVIAEYEKRKIFKYKYCKQTTYSFYML